MRNSPTGKTFLRLAVAGLESAVSVAGLVFLILAIELVWPGMWQSIARWLSH